MRFKNGVVKYLEEATSRLEESVPDLVELSGLIGQIVRLNDSSPGRVRLSEQIGQVYFPNLSLDNDKVEDSYDILSPLQAKFWGYDKGLENISVQNFLCGMDQMGATIEKIKEVKVGKAYADLLKAALPQYADSHLDSSLLFILEAEDISLPQEMRGSMNLLDALANSGRPGSSYGSEELPHPEKDGALQIEKGSLFVFLDRARGGYLPYLKTRSEPSVQRSISPAGVRVPLPRRR